MDQKIENGSGGLVLGQNDFGFGFNISLDSDRLAVRAMNNKIDSPNEKSRTVNGSIYIFKRGETNWNLEQILSNDLPGIDNLRITTPWGQPNFDLNGNRLAVGAHPDSGSSGLNRGLVYIFKQDGAGWSVEQKLSDQTAGLENLKIRDNFGFSVSLDGDRLAVGATGRNFYDIAYETDGYNNGAVYVFKRDINNHWQLEQKISNQTNELLDLSESYNFGHVVSLNGDRLAVGAKKLGKDNPEANFTYILKRNPETNLWSLEDSISQQSGQFSIKKPLRMIGGTQDYKLTDNFLAMGAHIVDGSGKYEKSVYVFSQEGGNWRLEQEILGKPSNAGLVVGAIVGMLVLTGTSFYLFTRRLERPN